MENHQNIEISILAKKLIRHIQNSLFFRYRFLEPAIFRLEMKEMPLSSNDYGTDGQVFQYSPVELMNNFKFSSTLEIRRYLHTIFHCIYQHPFIPPYGEKNLWGLACDIAIEAAIISQVNDFALPDDERRKLFIQDLTENVRMLNTQEVYQYLKSNPLDFETLKSLFEFDFHLWMREKSKNNSRDGDEKDETESESDESESENDESESESDETESESDETKSESDETKSESDETESESDESESENDETESESDENESESDETESESDENDSRSDGEDSQGEGENSEKTSCSKENSSKHDQPGQSNTVPNGSSESFQSRADWANDWKEVARKIMVDMNDFCQQGTEPGFMQQNINYLTRDNMDYEEFLQQFAVMEEKMMMDPDEFDYMFYMYGLGLKGKKKLLIEPLEYREVKQIREFVIAIDTSGSCSGELVKKFLNKTYSILKSTEVFSSTVNIHIIQCDACVQEDIAINNIEDIEQYAKNFNVKGLGGTDFRPVFSYVENLKNKGELTNLCGLIYFTDGYGTYPQVPTAYKTAFVFLDDYSEKDVPAWAMRIYWKEEI